MDFTSFLLTCFPTFFQNQSGPFPYLDIQSRCFQCCNCNSSVRKEFWKLAVAKACVSQLLHCLQWRNEAMCLPGPTTKVPPFPPLKFAYKNFKMKEDHVSSLFKNIGITKASWRSQWNTHKLKWVLFSIDDSQVNKISKKISFFYGNSYSL